MATVRDTEGRFFVSAVFPTNCRFRSSAGSRPACPNESKRSFAERVP